LVFLKKKMKKKNLPEEWKMLKKNGKQPTSHRSTTYPCYVPILGESAGAGRVGLAVANIQSFCTFANRKLNVKMILKPKIIKN